MKVVHIITGLNQGGAESALFRLITFNKSKSIENIVISMTSEGVYASQLRDAGIIVHVLGMPRRMVTLKGIMLLWKILKQEKPDAVQTWMYHSDLIGGIVAKIAGVKKILWGVVNFNLSKDITPLSTRLTAKLCAWVSGFVPDIIVSCSERAIIVHRKLGYSEKFKLIPLGFDIKEFLEDPAARINMRQKWNLAPNDIVIGCVARWDPQKDHKNLVQAFSLISKNHPDVKCVLVGPSMDKKNEELEILISAIYGNGNNIITAGVVAHISEAMNAFDIHILPSLGEAFPNVVAEAMACGIPCVVTDVGDASIIVADTGWVVPPADSTALALAMETAIIQMNNLASWQARKFASRKRILENYSMEKMVSQYTDIWN